VFSLCTQLRSGQLNNKALIDRFIEDMMCEYKVWKFGSYPCYTIAEIHNCFYWHTLYM